MIRRTNGIIFPGSAAQLAQKLYRPAFPYNPSANNLNIGIIYRSQANYAKADEYTLQVLPMIDSVRGDPQVAPKAMQTLGNIYVNEKKISFALPYYRRAIRIYEARKNEMGLATLYSHFTSIYMQHRIQPCIMPLRPRPFGIG